jgi:hypothetical protein
VSLTFIKRETLFGTYWRVLWKDRQAGLIVPVGLPRVYILLKTQETGYKELARTTTSQEAKQWFINKALEAKS